MAALDFSSGLVGWQLHLLVSGGVDEVSLNSGMVTVAGRLQQLHNPMPRFRRFSPCGSELRVRDELWRRRLRRLT